MANTNFPDLPHITDTSDEMDYDSGRYMKNIDLRWSHTFDRFRTGLPNLRRFIIGYGNQDIRQYESERTLPLERYQLFHCGVGPSQWVSLSEEEYEDFEGFADEYGVETSDFTKCDKEDGATLANLFEAVEKRIAIQAP